MKKNKAADDEPLQHGPLRRAPFYYTGETYGRHRIQYPDVERYANGVLPGVRNKAARRIIRGALKRRFSAVERRLKLPRGMLEQAREIISDNEAHRNKSRASKSRLARRLFAMELAIHRPVYAPEDLRALRTQKRKDKRAGKGDTISQLVDAMAGAKK